MSGAPMTATITVPTFPPAMWALIAKPRRSGGNCSASRPLPTGCCGEPPIRDSTLAIEKVRNDAVAACAAMPTPKMRPPAVRIGRRAMRRVTKPYVDWMSPEPTAPVAARNGIASRPMPNSATTSRKIGGSTTAWAWLTAWARARSQSVRSGRTSGSACSRAVEPTGSKVTPRVGRAPGSAGLGAGGAQPPRAQVAVAEADRSQVVDAADPGAADDGISDQRALQRRRAAGLDDLAQRVEVAAGAELREQLAGDETDQRLALDAGPPRGGHVHEVE